MNILREVRRINKKSMPARIVVLLVFCVIFVVSTYAWFSTQRDVSFSGLGADLTSWDVSYYVNNDRNEILDQIATFTIEELYPGMPERQDVVHIYNLGESSTNIEYELISVKVFGQEVLNELDINIDSSTNTTTIFSGDTAISDDTQKYPFTVSYTYDKDYLKNPYVDDVTTPQSHATFKFNVDWEYEIAGTDAQNAAKDALDTQFGEKAYAYYKQADSDPSKAIEIQVRITSSMIHPSLET